MEFQWGKNPEYTFHIYYNASIHDGEIALPFSLLWWNTVDARGTKNLDITLHILCFGITFEIWRWR